MHRVLRILFPCYLAIHPCVAQCPPGSIQGINPSDCYTYAKQSRTWYAAKEECIRQGGHLASAPNAFVNSFISNLVDTSLNMPGYYNYWLGGIADETSTDTWRWTDGTPFRFTQWAKGGESHNGTSCILTDIATANWNAFNCYVLTQFLCKVPPVQNGEPEPSKPPTSECKRCSSGWTYYSATDKCYKLRRDATNIAFHDSPKTWEEAEQRCVADGGHLASIHGPYEEQFITELVGTGLVAQDWPSNGVWIGLTNQRETDAYEWVDGTILDYVKWAPGWPLVDNVAAGLFYPDTFNGGLSYSGQAHFWVVNYMKDSSRIRASVCKKDLLS